MSKGDKITSKLGPTLISGLHGPENWVAKWQRPNLEIYSQNDHFGLVYDIDADIKAIHPCHLMLKFCISPLWFISLLSYLEYHGLDDGIDTMLILYSNSVFKISAGPRTLTGTTGVGPAGFPSVLFSPLELQILSLIDRWRHQHDRHRGDCLIWF